MTDIYTPYKRIYALVLACLFIAINQLKADSSSYWLTIDSSNFSVGPATSRLHTEFRFNELEEFSYFRVSEKFYWKLSDGWKLGTHPTIEGNNKGSWKNTYRLDLELNPAKIELGDGGPILGMRNRWEIRWKEGKGSEVFDRLRQYTTLTWKLSDVPLIKSYTLANEVFYEWDKSMITINRFYPIVVSLKDNLPFKNSLYYMYQSKRVGTSDDWGITHVFGMKMKF